MAARNREGFRSIISYGDVLDGNGRGRRSSRPWCLDFQPWRGGGGGGLMSRGGRKVERL